MKAEFSSANRDCVRYVVYVASVLIACVLFFFFLGESGTQYYKDSGSYIEWSFHNGRSSYTLYPAVLRVIRSLHGENYLDYIYVYQGVLSIICNVILVEYVRKKYKLGMIVGFVMHVLMMLTYSFTLPEVVASHYVATEGICIPLFILSVYMLLRYYLERSYFCYLMALVLCFVQYRIRPQSAVFAMIFMVLFVFNELYLRFGKKDISSFWIATVGITALSVMVAVAMLFRIIADWTDKPINTQLVEALTGKALCLLTAEDSNMYEGELGEIYNRLYEDCKDRGGLLEGYQESILDYEVLHEMINDNITAHETVIWNYFIDKTGEDGGLEAFSVRNTIASRELLKHKAGFWGIVLRLMPSSMVAAVFVQPRSIRLICYIISAIIYSTAIILVALSVIKKSRHIYWVPLAAIMFIIIVNSLASNLVLYGQQRYVVYCMGMFYLTLLLAATGFFRILAKRDEDCRD